MKQPTHEEIVRNVKTSSAIEGVHVDLLPFKMQKTTPQEKWRAATFWEKEPETIEWIRGFAPGSVMWDVGANVGIYTLFAASLGHTVLAFEPLLANWAALTNNVALNGYQVQVTAILAGIGERTGFERFATDRPGTGTSGGQLGGEGRLSYDLPVYALDSVSIWTPGRPDHVKIDIDGLEDKVIAGMRFMIEWQYPKSVLIEIPKAGAMRDGIQGVFEKNGYTTANHINRLENHSRFKAWRRHADIENVVFTKAER